ncbi:phasin family protein [Litorivicinus lipolyticus]|nr:phasin family protein [Litorivicinus lipolyticus]
MSKNVESMFDTAKYEDAMKPMAQMVELNKKMLETLATKQADLVKELFEGSVAQAKELTATSDLSSALASQKNYLEGVQEKLVSAARDTQDVLTVARDEATAQVQTAVEGASKFQ